MKNLIFLLFLLLVQLNVFSQEKKNINEHFIGLKGGRNLYMMNNDFLLSNKNSLGESILLDPYNYGYSVGISYKNFFEKNAGTVFGINYTQKGGYSEFLNDEDTTTIESDSILFFHKLELIEFPFMMNLRFGKGHSRINFYLGPSISYIYRQELIVLEETLGRFYKAGTDSKIEFAVNIAAGYAFSFNKGEVELNLMFSQGLTNVFKVQSINTSLYNQTQAITASLYYYYKIKKE